MPTAPHLDRTTQPRQPRSEAASTSNAHEKPKPSLIIVGLALRDDDSAPLALAYVLARLTGASLALVTAYAYGAPPFVASERLAATRERAELALARPPVGPSDGVKVLTLRQTRGVSRACPA